MSPVAKKKKSTRTKKMAQKPLSRSLRVYQRIAILFVVVSFLLLLFVLYLSVSSATVRVTPNPQVVSHEVSVEIVPEAKSHGQVSGYVRQTTLTLSDSFELPEDGATATEAKAGGLVTIINETTSDQALVATTRLLSEEGILFRIDEAITVPAGGETTTIAHADEPGLAGEIAPTQFTIPGLSPSLQEVIYGVSTEAMTGGVQYIQTLNESHMQDAYTRLETRARDEAVLALADGIDTAVFDGSSIDVEILDQSVDTEVGTQIGSFGASISVLVTGLFYEEEAVMQYASALLQTQVGEDYELASVSDTYVVEVRSVDVQAEQASLRVSIDGVAVISTASDILDPERLLGRTPREAETILETSELVDDISIRFTPFWLKRIPSLEDHIKIIVDY